MNTVLKVKNLVKYFKVNGRKKAFVHAVDDVSFAIKQGETFGLVGESGCGKSTCARTIMRIYEPTSGNIHLLGEDISHMSQKSLHSHRKNFQMIFQDPYSSLNPRMVVRDIIAEPLNAHKIMENSGERNEYIKELLETVGLRPEHINRYPHEFSGGQRQRVGIARALALGPKLLVCDEAISALDVSIQAQIINMLKKLQDKHHFTYLFIAHDLSMVRYVSDKVGVMYLGEIVEMSTSEEIYSNPLHPYTQGLLDSVPIPDPGIARSRSKSGIEGDIASPINPPSGCRFHTRCKWAMDKCKNETPKLKQVSDGHCVACFLHE